MVFTPHRGESTSGQRCKGMGLRGIGAGRDSGYDQNNLYTCVNFQKNKYIKYTTRANKWTDCCTVIYKTCWQTNSICYHIQK